MGWAPPGASSFGSEVCLIRVVAQVRHQMKRMKRTTAAAVANVTIKIVTTTVTTIIL